MDLKRTNDLYDELREAFDEVMEYEEFSAGSKLHHAGAVCNKLFFVERGNLRAYYYFKGNDVTAHFASDKGSITAPDSFIKGEISKYHIEVLTDSSIHVIRKSALEKHLAEHPHLERLARHYTEEVYLEMLERVEGIIFLSAKERYEQLLKRHPGIDQKVNLGHISSYLGITQETLSRVRGSS